MHHVTNLESLLRIFMNSEEFSAKLLEVPARYRIRCWNYHHISSPSWAIGGTEIPVGNETDNGGYVMLDDFNDVVGALSAGIGGDCLLGSHDLSFKNSVLPEV